MIVPEWLFELPTIEPERIEFRKLIESQIMTQNTKLFFTTNESHLNASKSQVISMHTKNENFPIRPNAKWNFYLKSLSYDVHFNENSWKNSESTRPRLFLFIWKSSISTDCLVPRIIQFYFSMSLFDDWTQIRCSNSRKCSRKSLALKLRISVGKPERNQE